MMLFSFSFLFFIITKMSTKSKDMGWYILAYTHNINIVPVVGGVLNIMGVCRCFCQCI